MTTQGAKAPKRDRRTIAVRLRDGDRTAALAAIAAGADVNARSRGYDGCTPLNWAVANSDAEMVDALLAAGADPNRVGRCGDCNVVLAVENQNPEMLRVLLAAGADPNVGCVPDWPIFMLNDSVEPEGLVRALAIACTNGDAACARALVEYGATMAGVAPAERGSDRLISALEATCKGWCGGEVRLDVVEALLDAGHIVDRESLIAAIVHGNARIVERMLRAADVSKIAGGVLASLPASFGRQTAAMDYGESVRMLLAAGFSPNTRSDDGDTPLHVAVNHRDAKVIGMLLQAGAIVDARDQHGLTALQMAVESPNAELAMQLIEAGADLSVTVRGRTLLHLAARAGCHEMSFELIKRGLDVNARDEQGESVLSAAGEGGLLGVVRELLDRGADTEGALIGVVRSSAFAMRPASPPVSAVRSAKIMHELISRGARMNDTEVGHVVLVAARAGAGNFVRHILATEGLARIGQRTVAQLLGICVDNEMLDIADTLIDAGAETGSGALSITYERAINKSLVDWLIRKGASAKSVDGVWSALHEAACRDDVSTMRTLVSAGADVMTLDQLGRKPIDWVTKEGAHAFLTGLMVRAQDHQPA